MRAFVTKIYDFFKLDTGKEDDEKNFRAGKRSLKIPLYQREYKWENEKISALISDIKKQRKFLGNVILDESTEWHEIADGQQRITTCYLILVYLYNFYHGSPLEQQSLLNILKPYNEFVLVNNTVGTYLYETQGRIELRISEDTDIYFQKADFERAYREIARALSFITTPAQARDFKDKLLNSEILILINDERPTTPIEQIFLDINEKAQLLDTEDIFKGHCFEIFAPEFHTNLRETWVELKKCASGFRTLGIKSLSDYIYLFLLEHDGTDLPKKLNPNGRHYLEGKTMDATNTLLQEMISYGQSVLQFTENLRNTPYRFVDICPDSHEHRNTDDHLALKAMGTSILTPQKPLYQKLPFMYFIYNMSKDETLRQEIRHDSLRRIITNLYIYASLFALNSEKKSKTVIDHSLRDAAKGAENRIANIVSAAKALRISLTEEYNPNPFAKFDELATVYTITDNYESNANWIPVVYSHEENFNLEHFIIPDQRAAKIRWWVNDTQHFDIEVPLDFAKSNKKKTCNMLIIDHDLNEDLDNYDVIKKIEMIQSWHSVRGLSLPAHVDVFFSFIQSMPEYQILQQHKNGGANEETVKADYLSFLRAYFADEGESVLLLRLKEQFKAAFRN